MITIKIERLSLAEYKDLEEFIKEGTTIQCYSFVLEPYSNTLEDVEITFRKLEDSIAFLISLDNARFARS